MTTSADFTTAIEAAEAESAAALREGAEMVAAGLLRVGAAFLAEERAADLSRAARKAGADVRLRDGLVPSAVQHALQEAIERAYPRRPRETSRPWTEAFTIVLAVRDSVPAE